MDTRRVTIEHSTRWVPVGDPAQGLHAPATISARVDQDDGPTVTVTVRISEDGRPYCAGVALDAGPDGAPVTAADLRRVHLDDLVNSLIAGYVLEPPFPDREPSPGSTPDAFHVGYIPAAAKVAQVVESRRRRRVEVTPDRLRAVAAAYRRGRGDGGSHAAGIHAVRDELHVSRQRAYGLVDRAVEAGFIDQSTTTQQED